MPKESSKVKTTHGKRHRRDAPVDPMFEKGFVCRPLVAYKKQLEGKVDQATIDVDERRKMFHLRRDEQKRASQSSALGSDVSAAISGCFAALIKEGMERIAAFSDSNLPQTDLPYDSGMEGGPEPE